MSNDDFNIESEVVRASWADEIEEKSAEPLPTFDADLVPAEQREISDEDIDLDREIKSYPIVSAYEQWFPSLADVKIPVGHGHVNLRCPVHDDQVPSASFNYQTQLWNCHSSECIGHVEGDIYDLAVFAYPGEFRDRNSQFPQIRQRIAEDLLGHRFHKGLDGKWHTTPPVEAVKPEAVKVEEKPKLASVTTLVTPEDEDAEDATLREELASITIDWRDVLPGRDTFLDIYMPLVTKDDAPDPFHLGMGLLGVGLAGGRRIRAADKINVLSNVFICLLAGTGEGKSTAISHLLNLLEHWKFDPRTNPKAAKVIRNPGSAEYMVKQLMNTEQDPTTNAIVNWPVTALGVASEFSHIAAKSGGKSNPTAMIPKLQQMYDGDRFIEAGSLSRGDLYAQDPYVSFVTSSQPRSLRHLVGQKDIDSGFVNRFWFFSPGPLKDPIGIGGVQIDITDAVKPFQAIHSYSVASTVPNGGVIPFSPEALDLWNSVFDTKTLIETRRDPNGVLTRLDLGIKKLALLFAMNLREYEISGEAMNSALKMYPYLRACYEFTRREIQTTDDSELFTEMDEFITSYKKDKGRAPSDRFLIRRFSKPRGKREIQEVNRCIEGAVKAHIWHIKRTPPNTPGRPADLIDNVG